MEQDINNAVEGAQPQPVTVTKKYTIVAPTDPMDALQCDSCQ